MTPRERAWIAANKAFAEYSESSVLGFSRPQCNAIIAAMEAYFFALANATVEPLPPQQDNAELKEAHERIAQLEELVRLADNVYNGPRYPGNWAARLAYQNARAQIVLSSDMKKEG